MANAPMPQIDRTTGAILIGYLLSVGTLAIVAGIAVPGMEDKIIGLAAPVGAVLVLARQQQKTDNTAAEIKQDTAQIKHAVNGEMGAQFDDLRSRVVMLEGGMAEIRDDLKRLLHRTIPPP